MEHKKILGFVVRWQREKTERVRVGQVYGNNVRSHPLHTTDPITK